ncbi:hypothetical protein FM076_14665 [Streptomyces albus subsp. chlorinus]|nr:hypothetical protein [Streptomyces albus subsp. chlorinus]
MAAPPIVVYPPDEDGGRRVRARGAILGRAYSTTDLLEFLRRAGLDPDDITLDDTLLQRLDGCAGGLAVGDAADVPGAGQAGGRCGGRARAAFDDVDDLDVVRVGLVPLAPSGTHPLVPPVFLSAGPAWESCCPSRCGSGRRCV